MRETQTFIYSKVRYFCVDAPQGVTCFDEKGKYYGAYRDAASFRKRLAEGEEPIGVVVDFAVRSGPVPT